MFRLVRAKAFERDVEKFLKKHGDADRLEAALLHLQSGKALPAWFRDHQLQGKLRHYREIHVEHDWLLVYERDGKELRVVCLRLVTHKKLRELERSM